MEKKKCVGYNFAAVIFVISVSDLVKEAYFPHVFEEI
jgi:hypothetical protein